MSVRRTTSIDAEWPNGAGENFLLVGGARDIRTGADGGAPEVVDRASFRMTVSPRREIVAIEGEPDDPGLREMIGVRAGGASREAMKRHLGHLRGTPLYQLIDDYAGASLVAGWALTRWVSPGEAFKGSSGRDMTGICTGFSPGSQAMDEKGFSIFSIQSATRVVPLANPEDPDGIHAMPEMTGKRFRRARRIDLWREEEVIRFDAGFQDSGSTPDGTLDAVHEYRVYGEVNPETGTLISLQALPLILPYAECPGASMKASRMVGRSVAGFRDDVPEILASTMGCTHLNDVLRALSDIPALAQHL
jgi:Protein of unknown function (DUF2889).